METLRQENERWANLIGLRLFDGREAVYRSIPWDGPEYKSKKEWTAERWKERHAARLKRRAAAMVEYDARQLRQAARRKAAEIRAAQPHYSRSGQPRKYPPCPRYASHLFGRTGRCPCGYVRPARVSQSR